MTGRNLCDQCDGFGYVGSKATCEVCDLCGGDGEDKSKFNKFRVTKKKKESAPMFEVDAAGYRAQMAEMKPVKVVYELIANANDEDSVKKFDLSIQWKDGKVIINYRDDGAGFKKISDVWTMYGHSERRGDPTKSGRFNLGEKEFLVLALIATLETFDRKMKKRRLFEFENDTRVEDTDNHRICNDGYNGTRIYAEFDRWSKEQYDEICKDIKNIYVKPNKTCKINGQIVNNAKPHKTFTAELPTLIAAQAGQPLSKVVREAQIDLYDKKTPDSVGYLFENGLPIQKQSPRTKWHVNVNQKVPLAPTRVSVPSSYWHKVCGAVLNNTVDELDHEDSGRNWVSEGMNYATKDTAKSWLKIKFPDKDSNNICLGGSDHQANEECIDAGGGIISTGTLDKEARQHLMDLGVVQRASEKYGEKGGDAGGRYAETEQHVKPNDAMVDYAIVCTKVAKDCIGVTPTIRFVKSKRPALAWYNRDAPSLTFNVKHLGTSFFNSWDERNVQLLIHELAHHGGHGKYEYEIEHYSKQFVDELERIGGIIGHRGIESWL